MLGKALKYEFGATGRIFLPCYAVLIGMSAVARLFYTGGINNSTPTVLITMIMAMLFAAVWVVTVVIIIRRFWTNLLGREGYLVNTLPVAPWQHVFSKLLTSTVWCIASLAASLIAIFIMVGAGNIHFGSIGNYINEAVQALREHQLTGQAVLICVETFFAAVFSCFAVILHVYASMSIGQLANKHRIWASIGAFFGINIIVSTISSVSVFGKENGLLFLFFGYSTAQTANDMAAALSRTMLISLIWALILSAIFFFVTSLILHRHLNLQ